MEDFDPDERFKELFLGFICLALWMIYFTMS